MTTSSAVLEEQVTTLRHELKIWENAFKTEQGRRPGREDIKQNAAIAEKYRQYNDLRRPAVLASKERTDYVRTPGKKDRPGRGVLKARSSNAAAPPRRADKTAASLQLLPAEAEPESEPTPAAIRCALGPTPQKDGQVLGIFDLPFSATPSKGSTGIPSAAEAPTVVATPSKRSMALPVAASTLLATPQSSGKRRFLNAFTNTPLKRKRDEDDNGASSTVKRQFATPAFLRRSASLANISLETEAHSSRPLLRRPLSQARSFSSLIQNLRSIEEERMDDDWDIMNEIEAQERGDLPPIIKKKVEVLVEDSQVMEAGEMPLGPDRAAEDDEKSDEYDAAATTGKVWKKKGLKRQTKRTHMKPVLHKPKKAAELERVDEVDGLDVVNETQRVEGAHGDSADENADASIEAKSGGRTKRTKGKEKKNTRKDLYGDNDSENPKKKIAATAHANFRALKIKNKNSKAGGRGRFGKGRR